MFKHLTALTLLGLLATACAAPSPLSDTQLVETFGQSAVFANSNEGGNRTARIEIAAPNEGGYNILAAVHHWVDNDIVEYRATLKAWNGTAYADFATPLQVVVPRKGTPKNSAVFTNLKQGSKYQVSLQAWGDDGGNTATSQLNADTATTAVFDFTATQDVEDAPSETMTITFDQVAFSGTGTATVSTPADGTYQNPSSAEAGSAQ